MADDLIIRPSTKLILGSYVVGGLLLIAGALLPTFGIGPQYWFLWIIPGVAYLAVTGIRHLAVLMSKLVISEDRLHHESGFVSKQTHTIDLGKVQDVRVDQSVKQRLLNIGTVTVETAGGGSKIAVDNVDGPQKIADEILSRSRRAPHHL
jgi:uncharacterized membrane protein YdbT with pleckstrin-like domain